MGLSVLGPGGTETIPVRAAIEIGPGDIFVALTLIYVLAYLYLLDPVDISAEQKSQIRTAILAAVIPLFVTFVGVVLFTSIELL